MFDDYVLYLVESLQSHERYNELLASIRQLNIINNNNNSSSISFCSFAHRVVKYRNSLSVDLVDFSTLNHIRQTITGVDFTEFLLISPVRQLLML